jgi:hypothetical protein
VLDAAGEPSGGRHLHDHAAPALGAVARRLEGSGTRARGVVTGVGRVAAPVAVRLRGTDSVHG